MAGDRLSCLRTAGRTFGSNILISGKFLRGENQCLKIFNATPAASDFQECPDDGPDHIAKKTVGLNSEAPVQRFLFSIDYSGVPTTTRRITRADGWGIRFPMCSEYCADRCIVVATALFETGEIVSAEIGRAHV